MAKKISDEELIAALISCGTMKAAAETVGLTERTVYDRMQDGDFKARYKAVKADIVRRAVFDINSKLGAALDTVLEIMQDKNNRPETRLQAADKVFLYADKFAKRLSTDEHAVSQQISSNNFHIDL
jgi:hypothetical protein